ncbi:uncharacterized protein LOC129804218 [Phlebotomus papatasi]|uniref:uncharacterized protein LOC129804218 n=1 Tax=Phlebotomus papatasi TaxID=29031 RepID=UPI002483B19D|nr:uncharacterized protein LOC129804218 [Phlebotomus papatasi]
MIAIFSCHAVLCILVAPVWSSPVPSSKVADASRKTLNPVRNAAVASLTRTQARDEGWSDQNTTESNGITSNDVLHVAKPGSSVASNFLLNLMQNNNAVHLAFEGEPPKENYANLPYTPILDYAFIKPDNESANSTPNWQDTLANIQKNPAFQGGAIVKLPPIKIVGAGSESKFPLVLEIFAQRIQSMFSTYAHEDLSRPPVWNSSQYQANLTAPTTLKTTILTTRKPIQTTPTRTTRTTRTTRITRSTGTTRTTRKITRATTRKPTQTTTKYLPYPFPWVQSSEDQSDLPNESTEIVDITYTKPIPVENDTYIYVGEGDDEFDRGIHRRKPRGIPNTFL